MVMIRHRSVDGSYHGAGIFLRRRKRSIRKQSFVWSLRFLASVGCLLVSWHILCTGGGSDHGSGNIPPWSVGEHHHRLRATLNYSSSAAMHHETFHSQQQRQQGQNRTDLKTRNDPFEKGAQSKSDYNPDNPCAGREKLLELASRAAGIQVDQVNVSVCKDYPSSSWQEGVVEAYGEQAVVVGMDTCRAFQASMEARGWNDRETRKARIGGLHNTGTNALSRFLNLNLDDMLGTSDISAAQRNVPWGKHVPVWHKYNNTFPEENPDGPMHLRDTFLPVIIIKDPIWWHRSMCKISYSVVFFRHFCTPPYYQPPVVYLAAAIVPNFTRPERVLYQMDQIDTKYTEKFPFLFSLWSAYYRSYLDDDKPRLMVRFEDLLYRTEAVIQAVRDCLGVYGDEKSAALAPSNHENNQHMLHNRTTALRYFVDAAKYHGDEVDFTRALFKYSQGDAARLFNISEFFLQTAVDELLDPVVMETFHYRWPRARSEKAVTSL